MRTSTSRSGVAHAKLASDREAARGPPPWGLRANYRMLRSVLEYLNRAGPKDRAEIADHLIHEAPGSRRPNSRRSTGMSSAEQVVVTLKNLGLVERVPGAAHLTTAGREFAQRIGTPDEERGFREIVISNPAFRWVWEHVSGSRNLGRSDAIALVSRIYSGYNEETRNTLVGVFMNYSRAAGLLREGPGGRRYAVSNVRIPGLYVSEVLPDPAAPERVPADAQVETAVPSDGARDSLGEVARLLGWALAEESMLSDPILRGNAIRAFDQAAGAEPGRREKALIELAGRQAQASFERGDADLLRWTVRLVNLIHAMPAASRSPRKVSETSP